MSVGFIGTENNQKHSRKTECMVRDSSQGWKGKLTGKWSFSSFTAIQKFKEKLT